MIIDKIENAHQYKGISMNIAKALNYIEATNFSKLSLGKHEIDGDNIYAIISEYLTKEKKNDPLEAHYRYIDLHYLIDGFEAIGVVTHKNQQAVTLYNEEDDFLLYKEAYNIFQLTQGMFAIFFPDDMHLPGINTIETAKVKKVVIKIKI